MFVMIVSGISVIERFPLPERASAFFNTASSIVSRAVNLRL